MYTPPPDPRSNEDLFEMSVKNLEDKGFIEFSGEYGNEVATFVPFVAWLKREGLLVGREVLTYAGMRPYYFFLENNEFKQKNESRRVCFVKNRWWPSNATHTATRERWHVSPDYRSHFKEQGRSFKKPVIFIQNKFTVEWGMGPINYIPLNAIRLFLEKVHNKFDVVYSRPGIMRASKDYSVDQNDFCSYPDLKVVREFNNVEILEEVCIRDKLDYNRTKLEYLAKSHLFVAAQGGGAHIASAFGNSILLVLHRSGSEYPHAYAQGPYKYLAERPPILLVARDDKDFAQGLEIVSQARVTERGAELHPSTLSAAARLAL